MPVAAHTTGGHSTADVLIGLAILIWALGAVAALLGWLLHGARARLKRRRRASAASAAAGPIPAAAPAGAANPGAGPAPAAGANAAAPPRQAPAGAERAASLLPPAIPGARLSPEQLEPVGILMDNARRLTVAEARVDKVLAELPGDRWFVERYVLVAGHRIPFLILGETGVFALWALPGPPQWRESPFAGGMAANVKNALPGYTGEVQPGVCRAFAPNMKPRWWCRPGEPGVWVMSLDWLIRWLEHFGPEDGLGVKDLERLRELAGPRWGRPLTDTPLSAHIPSIG